MLPRHPKIDTDPQYNLYCMTINEATNMTPEALLNVALGTIKPTADVVDSVLSNETLFHKVEAVEYNKSEENKKTPMQPCLF